MSWVKTDFWLGAPMKGFRLNPRTFKDNTDLLMDFYSHPAQYEALLTLLFEQAGVIPEHSILIGVQSAWEHTDIILVFMNTAFERVEEGSKYPVDDNVIIDKCKWDTAMVIARAARDRMKALSAAGQVAALEVR